MLDRCEPPVSLSKHCLPEDPSGMCVTSGWWAPCWGSLGASRTPRRGALNGCWWLCGCILKQVRTPDMRCKHGMSLTETRGNPVQLKPSACYQFYPLSNRFTVCFEVSMLLRGWTKFLYIWVAVPHISAYVPQMIGSIVLPWKQTWVWFASVVRRRQLSACAVYLHHVSVLESTPWPNNINEVLAGCTSPNIC